MVLRTRDVDVWRVAQAYLYTNGDVYRTALLSSTEPQVVKQLASEHDWASQLTWIAKPGAGPDDDERRKLNRETNYLQAVQLRAIVDRVIGHLHEGGPEALSGFLETLDKKGKPVPSMKPLLELTKAAETVQAMTYASLDDKKAIEELGQTNGKVADLALTVAKSMDRLIQRSDMAGGSAIPVVAEVLDSR